jgi:PAS domain S-box-containing protein
VRNIQVQTHWKRAGSSGAGGISQVLKILLSGLLLFLSVPFTIAQDKSKNVLVVFSTFERDPLPLQLIESSARARVQGPVNFSVTYLDYRRLDDDFYRESLAETLRREFRDVKPDVLVAASMQAIRFVVQYRDRMFPGVPIVFFGVSAGELEGQKMLPEMTGVTDSPAIRQTIDLAIRLHPDTTAVAIIADTPGKTEKYWVGVTHSELLRHQDKVKEIDIIGLPRQEMLEKIAALPPHTVALFELAPSNSTEPEIGAYDVLAATARRVPTYSPFHTLCFNYGCLGGAYPDWQKDDLLTGDIAGRLLAGERAENILPVDTTNSQIQVDWRELQRWHIPESALPTGSVILYRKPTFWEQHRQVLIAVIALSIALAVLMVALVRQRARKRKAEALLRESEKRFRVMADTTPSTVWMCDPQGKVTYVNDRRIAFTGRDPMASYDDFWTTFVHPDDRRNVQDVVSQALRDRRAFSNEYRLRRSDGIYRWMFDVASPRVNGDGTFAGFIGSAIDVTDQKVAQQALEKVSGQLIEAQEKERLRIARDLHDDICQRLALLSMELDQANRSANESDGTTKHRLREIRQHCSEIAGDVQSLSHELHSSRLDYLGIVAAIRGFCHEFSRQHQVSIEFTDRDVPGDLPREISLCLFRVAQEALHNAVKYSGVSQYVVELTATAEEIQLVVSDSGRGFDVEAVKQSRGLGLVSMQERVHLVHGSLHVESAPGAGTRILAVVPLVSESHGSPEEEPEGVAGAA